MVVNIIPCSSLCLQSMPITTKVVSLNPSHGEVWSIQQHVIKFFIYLKQVGGFLWVPYSGFINQ